MHQQTGFEASALAFLFLREPESFLNQGNFAVNHVTHFCPPQALDCLVCREAGASGAKSLLAEKTTRDSGARAPGLACPSCGLTQDEIESITARFRACASEVLETEIPELSMHTTLNELGADSLATIELLVRIEQQFGVTINERTAEDFATVGDVVAFLARQSRRR